ncbi:hypothetical protein HDU85_003536 [Gaertneriomyces sp. JEL0708]|nr:hypothetical protein HDU85_003536 [Gaertneriomyces sp. JEL0708]
MATKSCPFPATGTFISTARAAASKVREEANIKICIEAADRLLKNLSKENFDRLKSQHGVAFPLIFPNLVTEVNFLSVLALLNTLSGYRAPFHKATGQGAYQNVLKLLFGLYIGGGQDSDATSGSNALSARGLKSLDAATVAELLGVTLHEEKPHESIPGLVVGIRGGDINEAIELVVGACNETGERLLQRGYANLGVFVLEALKEAEGIKKTKSDTAAADYFVERLVTVIPGFADMSLALGNQPVYIFKKASFLLFALHHRLSKLETSSPAVPDPSVLPMFVDNVIPTMLVDLGIVDLSECKLAKLQQWGKESISLRNRIAQGEGANLPKVVEGPRLTREEAYVVRAAAVDAGQVVIKRAKELGKEASLEWLGTMTEADLDGYLWSVAKDDPLLRKIPRMVERNTIMY